MTPSPLVSVIVPTRDRPIALARCLDALDAQTIADQMEVIVVDDAAAEGDDLGSIVGRHPRARLVHGRGRGPAAARNAGARVARGNFFCFTDDDCTPSGEWVEQMVHVLRGGADAVAGTTSSVGGALAIASDVVARAPTMPIRNGASDEISFAPSYNLGCTRVVFSATPFDETYPYAAGEDREWCARLVTSGRTLHRAQGARVLHHPELTPRRFFRQQARYGEGAFRFRRLSGAAGPLESPAFYLALVRDAFTRGPAVGLLVCAAQLVTALGFARGWMRERKHRYS